MWRGGSGGWTWTASTSVPEQTSTLIYLAIGDGGDFPCDGSHRVVAGAAAAAEVGDADGVEEDARKAELLAVKVDNPDANVGRLAGQSGESTSNCTSLQETACLKETVVDSSITFSRFAPLLRFENNHSDHTLEDHGKLRVPTQSGGEQPQLLPILLLPTTTCLRPYHTFPSSLWQRSDK